MVHALLDSGSMINMISASLAEALNLPKRPISVKVTGVGEQSVGASFVCPDVRVSVLKCPSKQQLFLSEDISHDVLLGRSWFDSNLACPINHGTHTELTIKHYLGQTHHAVVYPRTRLGNDSSLA